MEANVMVTGMISSWKEMVDGKNLMLKESLLFAFNLIYT
jgi:hypothetical protein